MLVYLTALETEQEKTKFEQLYLTYRQTMFYVANSILHDSQLAEDAVHQAFLRIMDHMGNILEVECPQTKSFVVIIVKNIAINFYNRRKKQSVLSFDELADWSAERTATPKNEMEAQEGYDCLIELIGRMPESYRSVLLLKYDNGYSTAEIASMLDLTEENVKKRIQRARKKLEQILGTEEVNT
ncbi:MULTISPECIES: RNA polymerase sigma factor [Anaerotruncus]|jgi:RNA polymerase sigma-70 factor (ECF subfamily)|uniref:Sigma-70 family RNA polymerase sigma factor n=1 Tax=Anaerotruncus colihominis TaxID=169435 RepID=A0A845SSW8_9FIRM|nr:MULTISPECIES: sigma-70 family RNA polymerase sigma factor [Anaerotruncus]MCI8492321.1 sigma-70 family RNA polymerase sigma factor [Anaerotruncus sp.]MCR2026311.1 sigma-70 family RNA polymerase sigma factor [Anaerotruncus colihominis]NBI77647.1 sigma-70 family RNA polymerase sigma factor [Anaerotruncus colihominis]NDO38855.1 sigma-70 family RNA polymerase sigma factor [Anaerotruncus colihominis]